LWISRAVRELIERRFEKRLGLTAVQLYLRRWGMTPQKPMVRAKEPGRRVRGCPPWRRS
jgi:transposase